MQPPRSGTVPAGWSGIRADLAHYARIHGATTAVAKVLLPLRAPSLLALAVYRFGRWAYGRPRPAPIALSVKALYRVLFWTVRKLTRVGIAQTARIGAEVWLASGAPLVVMASIGRGSVLLGSNTLGSGGGPGARGAPRLGERVVVGPGAVLFGPIEVPDGCVIGPNSVVRESLAAPGAYLGAPVRPFDGPPQALIPAWRAP